MSVAVAAPWEKGWTVPAMEYDSWVFMLKDHGVDRFCVFPVSGIDNGTAALHCEHASMEEAITSARDEDRAIVFVDENGEADLETFHHPDHVCYVFGKSNYNALMLHHEEGDASVRIRTPNSKGGMWGHQAAAVVLWDRFMKQG